MDQNADAGEEVSVAETQTASPRGKAGFGIGARLYMAFGALTVLTVVAVGVSVVAFDRVGNTLGDVTERSMPAVATALGLAVESAKAAAAAPGLISADTPEARQAVKAQMEASVQSIDSALQRIAASDPSTAAELLDLEKVLVAQMTELETAVDARNGARDRLTEARAAILKLHQDFLSAMLPVVDDANFNLVISGSDTVDEADATIAKLIEEEVKKLQSALSLSTDGQRLMGLLARSARTTDPDELAAEETEFGEIVAHINDNMSALGAMAEAEELKGVTERLLAFGEGDGSAFELRRQELKGKDLSFTELLSVQGARKALDENILDFGVQFEAAVDPVVEAARDSMKMGSEVLSSDLRTKIDTLVERDVAGLVTMLSALAEANLAVGQLNAGASALDIDRMTVYENAYGNSAQVLTGLAGDLETAGVGGAVIELTRQLAAVGDGDDGIFPLRRTVLQSEMRAQGALTETKRVAAEFDATVNTQVESAQASATGNAEAASDAIDVSISVLAVLALVNVAAGIAIGWLIVNRQVVRRLVSLSGVMRELADGNNDIEVDASGSDEIARMASTVVVFRDNAREVEQLRLQQEEAKKRAAEEADRQRREMADSFEAQVKSIVDELSAAAREMASNAGAMTDGVSNVRDRSSEGAMAAQATSSNVQTVASAAEELSASIREISAKISESSDRAREAADRAETTNKLVEDLERAAGKIDTVVTLIQDIAEQTNLLALNATIEAARAGDAGKGFAVVAGEVKSLAGQTAKATDEITLQIKTVQTGVGEAVESIRAVAESIREIDTNVTAVAGAVEEQDVSTQEIARSSQQAAAGTGEVSQAIDMVSSMADETGGQADAVLSAAQSLSSVTERLDKEVTAFLNNVRSAA